MRRSIKWDASPGAFIFLAFAFLVLPLRWIFAWFSAAAFHELCHYFAVMLCGGGLQRLSVGADGAVMDVTAMSRGKMLLCTLAGPAGGLLLVALYRLFPATAVCALFQSLYNLIPLYPLDGGRAIRCILELFFPETTAQRICNLITAIVLITVWLVAIYICFAKNLGLTPLFFPLVLLHRVKIEKLPCKLCRKRVQ